MAFSVEDILQEFAEATAQGKREYLDGKTYSFIRPYCKNWMSAEEYRVWLTKVVKQHREWRRRNPEKVRAWRKKRHCETYHAWRREYAKRWRKANPEKAKAADKRGRELTKANPTRLEKKRRSDRESSRRYRARKKNGLQR
jgi:hypothetical protein